MGGHVADAVEEDAGCVGEVEMSWVVMKATAAADLKPDAGGDEGGALTHTVFALFTRNIHYFLLCKKCLKKSFISVTFLDFFRNSKTLSEM